MPRFLIGLGSNLGDRRQNLDHAVTNVAATTNVTAQSSWFSYPAVGGPSSQGEFLNGAVILESSESPQAVLQTLQRLEEKAGRQRHERWGARSLDLDLLLADDLVIDEDNLTVPHPRMVMRRFVLEPAAEIAPDWIHPTIGWSIQRLFEHLASPPWFFLVGPNLSNCELMAQAIARTTGGVARLWSASELHDSSVESYPPGQQLAPAMSDIGFPVTPIISYADRIDRIPNWESYLPKLILVTEKANSSFSCQLRAAVTDRVPIVYLSSGRARALQDAVGAVLAMN